MLFGDVRTHGGFKLPFVTCEALGLIRISLHSPFSAGDAAPCRVVCPFMEQALIAALIANQPYISGSTNFSVAGYTRQKAILTHKTLNIQEATFTQT